MKKILGLLAVISGFCFATPAAAEDFEGIYDGYQVVYSPSSKMFSTGGMVEDRIILTKKTSDGSGSYSEYYRGDKLALSLGSNFELVQNGKLIACHNADLTFYNVSYSKGKFSESKMSEAEVQKLFPEAKIIRISEFENNKFVLKKKPFEKIEVLLLNDTDKNFYKYSFEQESIKSTDIAGLINIDSRGDVIFSHYGEDKYVIKVELSLF